MKTIKIKGYIGTAVTIKELFKWEKLEGFQTRLLTPKFRIMKKNETKVWKEIEITIREVI